MTASLTLSVEDRTVPGPHGAIPVRVYLPESPRRGLVWAHGGAFSFGGLDQAESDWVARELAARGVAVVAVDYRLSPTPDWMASVTGLPPQDGVHFPVASEEMDTVFLWSATLLPDLDATDWSLGGASAGANLAAGAALRLRDQKGPSPRSLLLAYGLFHATHPPLSPELATKFGALPSEAAVFTPEVLQLISVNYVGDPALLADPYAFPGGHDLTGLPPTFLLNSDFDSIRASAEQFAIELIAAGVDTLLVREPRTLHGHLDGVQDGSTTSLARMAHWLLSDLVRPR